MRKRLFSNPGLKIAALVLAFLIWLIIVNINDSIIVKTIYNVPITVSNASYLESMGMSYQLADGFETVTVNVRGNRSVVEPMTADNVTATADLTQIVNMDSSPIMVPVAVSAGGISGVTVSSTPGNIQITIENNESKDFVITGSAGETKPESGYEVGKLTASPEKMTLIGPTSVVEKIDTVVASVDVSNLSADTTMTGKLVIYDKNGEALTTTEMSYLKFNINENSIEVNVDLYRVIKVSLEAQEYTGSPAAGYQVSSMTVTPGTLSVVGDEDSLTALEQSGGKVSIDASAIDVSGKSSSFEVKIDDLKSLLPDGISLSEDGSTTAVVSVEILPLNSRSFDIPTSTIARNNLGSGLNCVFSLSKLTIGIKGSDDALTNLSTNDIKAAIDLSGLAAGTYTVPVTVTLPGGYSLVSDVTADVTLTTTESVAGTTAAMSGSSQ